MWHVREIEMGEPVNVRRKASIQQVRYVGNSERTMEHYSCTLSPPIEYCRQSREEGSRVLL